MKTKYTFVLGTIIARIETYRRQNRDLNSLTKLFEKEVPDKVKVELYLDHLELGGIL